MLPKTMKAAVVRTFGEPLRIEELDVPRPGPGQVLMRVAASGVCHTDLHAANGDWPVKPSPPFVPGHEGVGYVAAVGDGVDNLREGDAIGVPWLHSACGHCDYCLTGWETLCESQQNTGYSVNGGFAEYVLADADYVGQIPDGIAMEKAAPILCAGVTTYKGIKETDTKPGDWIVIVGVGGLGHVAVQYARAMGLRVAAVDVDEEKLKLASSLGAELVVDASECSAAKVIQEAIGGAHGALVTAVSTGIFRETLGMLRRGGTCSLVGLPPGDFPTPIFEVVLKRITIRGSIVGTRKDLRESLAFAAQGTVVPTTSLEPLESINSIFARMRDGGLNGRVVLSVD